MIHAGLQLTADIIISKHSLHSLGNGYIKGYASLFLLPSYRDFSLGSLYAAFGPWKIGRNAGCNLHLLIAGRLFCLTDAQETGEQLSAAAAEHGMAQGHASDPILPDSGSTISLHI